VIDNPFADELSTVTSAWSDQWFDDATALLWNPPGSFGGVIADQSVHLVPQSAWYAVALLRRDGPGDTERAVRVIDALLALQYDRPGVVWHGTFARFLEWPEPSAGAVEWDDYDPNWRQFLGTTWLVVLREFEAHLPAATVDALERSLRLCVEGEPADRVAAWYTNIALMDTSSPRRCTSGGDAKAHSTSSTRPPTTASTCWAWPSGAPATCRRG
jgi:hypothetical protein